MLQRWFMLGLCIATSPVRACLPVLETPPGDFGGASLEGAAVIWRDIGKVDLGHGFELPLRLRFDSSRSAVSPLVGAYWRFCLLESSAIRESETRLTVTLPFGPRVYFVRSNTDPTQYFSADREWQGRLKGDAFQAACARWEMTFWRGRLRTLVEKEKKRALTLLYNGTTPLGLRDDYLNQLVVQVVQEPGQPFPSAIVAQRKVYGLEFSGSQLQAITSPPQAGNLAPQVGPGRSAAPGATPQPSNQDRLSWGTDQAGHPQLRIALHEGGERLRVWDAQRGWIVADETWNYNLRSTGKKGEWPAVSRSNRQGQVEAYAFDNLHGVGTYRALDGTVTKKYYFLTKGPLWMKFRRQETLTNGRAVVTRQVDYDTTGRKLREINAFGTTEYVYQPQTSGSSNTVAASSLGPKMKRKVYDAQGRLLEWQISSNMVRRYTYPATGVVESVDSHVNGSWMRMRVVNHRVVLKTFSRGTTEVYDQAERLIETREANGSVERYIRNAAGEIVRTLRDGKLYSRIIREPESGRQIYVRYDEEGAMQYACDAQTRQHLSEEELAVLGKVLNERLRDEIPSHKEMQ